jgi:hypothetical protein
VGAYILFDGGAIHFDVVRNETVSLSAAVTEHPVEQGADIADHIRDELDKIRLEVFVANEPTDDVNSYGATTQMFTALVNHSVSKPAVNPVLGVLGAIANPLGALTNALGLDNGPPKDFPVSGQSWVGAVPAGFDFVKDMVSRLEALKSTPTLVDVATHARYCSSMAITGIESQPHGSGAFISIDLKAIKIVASSSVDVPKPTQARAKPKVPKGVQQPKVDQTKTILAGIDDAVGISSLLWT